VESVAGAAFDDRWLTIVFPSSGDGGYVGGEVILRIKA
jgi:hypothetical protein